MGSLGVANRPVVVYVPPPTTPVVWAVLGTLFAPGAGHLLYDRVGRGLVVAVLALVLPPTILHLGGPGFLMLAVVRIAAIADLLVGARTGVPSRRWLAGVAITHLFVLFGWPLAFTVKRIPSISMAPALIVGQRVVVDHLAYLSGGPARGDIIAFDHPCQPDRVYFKRVIATEGETVEVRCNMVYVDGKPVEYRMVEGDTCSYNDFDESNQTWSVRQCSEYAERVDGHEYFTFHDPARPLRDRLAHEDPPAAGDSRDYPRLDRPHSAPMCSTQPGGSFAAPGQKEGKVVETRRGVGPCELQLHYVVPQDHFFVMGDNRANSNDSRHWGSVPRSLVRGRVLRFW